MLKLFFTICILLTSCNYLFAKDVNEESVIVHADVPWQATDIVTLDNSILSWSVNKNDLWSFNKDIFPDGHSANGVEGIPALLGYVFPGENLGKLIGRIGDYGKTFPMGEKGEIYVGQGDGGNYLYLTINDEISQIYGKGFKDNKGELVITFNHKPLLTFNIQFIFYEKCPSYKYALKNLQEVMIEENIKDEINIIRLSDLQEAKNLRVIGSPTIRINNKDIDMSITKSTNFSLECRNYSFNGENTGWPNKEMIKEAFLRSTKEFNIVE